MRCTWETTRGRCTEDAIGLWTWAPDPYHPELGPPIGPMPRAYCEDHGRAFEPVGWKLVAFVACWSCGKENQDDWYVACGECGHTYSRLGLVLADWRVRRTIAMPLRNQLPRWPWNIWVCPCCVHDL